MSGASILSVETIGSVDSTILDPGSGLRVVGVDDGVPPLLILVIDLPGTSVLVLVVIVVAVLVDLNKSELGLGAVLSWIGLFFWIRMGADLVVDGSGVDGVLDTVTVDCVLG